MSKMNENCLLMSYRQEFYADITSFDFDNTVFIIEGFFSYKWFCSVSSCYSFAWFQHNFCVEYRNILPCACVFKWVYQSVKSDSKAMAEWDACLVHLHAEESHYNYKHPSNSTEQRGWHFSNPLLLKQLIINVNKSLSSCVCVIQVIIILDI